MKNKNICYWCGNVVNLEEGSREHLVPYTILKDVPNDIDTSELIISRENSHKKCNKSLADNFEHDFCQMIFLYGANDRKAIKHNKSKVNNLEKKKRYLKNQFSKMSKKDGNTIYQPSVEEDESFNQVIRKIIKGLYLKNFNQFLDLEFSYKLEIDRETQNLERDLNARSKVIKFLKLINKEKFIGNDVFSYRFKKAIDGKSLIWELLFYKRFPINCYLIHRDDEYAFK